MATRTPKHIEAYIVELWTTQGVDSPTLIAKILKRNKNFSIYRESIYAILRRNGIDPKEHYGK